MKCLSKLAMALCLMLSVCTPAFAADYTVNGQPTPDFAKPTSVDYVYTADGGAALNTDRSKDAALIPPGFGTGGICTLSALANPVSANPGDSIIAGATATYPASVSTPAAQATTAFTDVTGSLYYADGSLGTLSIPSLGLSVKIVQGTDNAALAKGVGHFAESSIWDGNVCLAAHNRGANSYFGQIHTLSIGDTVTLTTALGSRTYAVTNVAMVSETDRTALAASFENRVTLYTCVRDQRDYRWCVQAVELR